MKKNKALDKTNPRISGNIKLVMDSENNLFFESINSNEFLSNSLFKGFKYNRNLTYTTNLKNFVKQSVGFSKLYDIVDVSKLITTNSLYKQHHNLYKSGVYSEESQLINENFRCFAPIEINDFVNTPDYFVVLKHNKDDIGDILDSGEIVEVFDLSFIKENIFSRLENSYITTDLETLTVHGLDIENGTHITKNEPTFKQLIQNEQTITETNNWLTNIFKRNNMIYSNIVNLEFAFTDKFVDGRFVRYSGFYVNLSEFKDIKNTLSVIKSKNTLLNYNKNYTLKNYFNRTYSIIGNSFGVKKQSLIEFELLVNPTHGSIIQISIDGEVDYTLFITQDMIDNKSVLNTRRNIVREINNNYGGQKTTIRAELFENTKIRLITNNIIGTKTTLSVYFSSSSFHITNSKSDNKQHVFVTPNEYTILTNEYLNPNIFNYVMFEVDGVKKYIKIKSVDLYYGEYLYTLDEFVPKQKSGYVCWLVEQLLEEPKTCSITPIYELDMNMEQINHKNVYDFDVEKYKEYLFTDLENPLFIGNAKNYFGVDVLTDEQKQEYKDILRGELNTYFNGVEFDDDVFIKSIDPTTKKSVLIKNPFDRFNENKIQALRKYNRLYQFINKWCCGYDSSNNQNIFNISLPFKQESFNASHIETHRVLYKNTHDWFVLIDGLPNYNLTDNSLLSYSRYPLTEDSFNSQTSDVYEFLEHFTENEKLKCYSELVYDELQDVSFVYFKGVKYRIEKNLDNYKFSVCVKTSTQVMDDVFNVKVIQNDTFKTLTIFINFYIPEPILTSLERGERYYFVDKSLLYFSDKVYATKYDTVDFGVDKISLDLYNNTEQKTYLGTKLPHTNWYHTSNVGDILYVKRGNGGIFGTKFNDLLSVGGDFEIKYSETNDIESKDYGIFIQFKDIVEVDIDHFWCKQIIVKSVEVDSNDETYYLEQNVYELFKQDNNVFSTNNQLYISKAIAYELCYYDKIITQKANDSRYREMSLANMKTYFKTNNIKSNFGDVKIYVENFDTKEIVVNLQEDNGVFKKLEQPYTYQIFRNHLKYKPLTNIIQDFVNVGSDDNIIPLKTKFNNEFIKIVSKVNDDSLSKEISKQKTTKFDFDSYYEYVASSTNGISIINLPWYVAPREVKTPIFSLVMNTNEKIILNVDNVIDYKINLGDITKKYINKIVNIDGISSDVLVDYMNIYTNTNIETIQNYNVKDKIYDDFILNVLTKIYRVESIVDSTNQIIQFSLINNQILLNTYQTINGKLTIKLTR